MSEPTVLEIAVRIAEHVAPLAWGRGAPMPFAILAKQCLELARELKAQQTQALLDRRDVPIGHIDLMPDGRFMATVLAKHLPAKAIGPECVGIATEPALSLTWVIEEARRIHEESWRQAR